MNLLKSQWMTYVGVVIAAIAILSGVFGWFDPKIAWSVAGFFGMGSVVALRTYIDSSGYKTYVVAGFFIIISILVFPAIGVITLPTFLKLLSVFAPALGITFQQAIVKSKKE